MKLWTFNSMSDSEDAELEAKGYLGQRNKTSSREHSGWEGDFAFDLADAEAIDLEEAIIAKDADGLAPYKLNLVKVLQFRNGTTKTITYPEIVVKFKFSAGNREGYVSCSANWRADSRTVS